MCVRVVFRAGSSEPRAVRDDESLAYITLFCHEFLINHSLANCDMFYRFLPSYSSSNQHFNQARGNI